MVLRVAMPTVPRGLPKALGEDGNPSFETVRSILAAMGLRLTVEVAGCCKLSFLSPQS